MVPSTALSLPFAPFHCPPLPFRCLVTAFHWASQPLLFTAFRRLPAAFPPPCHWAFTALALPFQGLEDVGKLGVSKNFTGMTMLVMTPHCHAPSCLSQEMWTTTPDGETSWRRDCHFADTPSSSILKHLLEGEGMQQNDSLADG